MRHLPHLVAALHVGPSPPGACPSLISLLSFLRFYALSTATLLQAGHPVQGSVPLQRAVSSAEGPSLPRPLPIPTCHLQYPLLASGSVPLCRCSSAKALFPYALFEPCTLFEPGFTVERNGVFELSLHSQPRDSLRAEMMSFLALFGHQLGHCLAQDWHY